MGQVWSSADFDGVREAGLHGGAGSVLAVTMQNPGTDGVAGTGDDMVTPLNQEPCEVSVDRSPNSGCGDDGDRIRGFRGPHPGGGLFLLGDGSVRFVSENIDQTVYCDVSTISGGEVVGEF